jgi:hypothetical protein
MAVDRSGIAYVVYDDGELFRVSTLTGSCQPTSFVAGGFSPQFGMGFSANGFDAGETLFVVTSSAFANNGPAELATIDTFTFAVSPIGMVSPQIGDAELTGTGDAHLFAFAPGAFNAHVAELSKSDARVVSDVVLNLNEGQPQAWAFAFWGGDFYIFTSPTRGSTVVHRYTPGGSTTPEVFANVDVTIVGAGVSTCAPSN